MLLHITEVLLRESKMFKYLLLLITFIPLGIAQNPPDYPTTLPTHDTFTVLANSARDDLNTTITDSETSIILDDASEFFSPGANEAGIIKIDSEFIKYCTITSNTLTVCSGGRGFDGTTAAAHNAGATVLGIYASHHHNQLAAELIEVAESLGPVNTVANLPGTPKDGDMARVTDGSSSTDCVTGAGTDIVLCMYDSGVAAWSSVGGAASAAPTTATYITQTADATLSAEQALGALITGILKSTTTTGVVSIAVDGDFPSTLTRDTEWDTIAEIETATGYDFSSGTNLDTGTVADARIAATLSRDTEAVAAGDVSGSLSGGYTVVTADAGIVIDSNVTYGTGEGVAFGDGDTECFESADDILQCNVAGSSFFQLGGSQTALFKDTTPTIGNTGVKILQGAAQTDELLSFKTSAGSPIGWQFNNTARGLVGSEIALFVIAPSGATSIGLQASSVLDYGLTSGSAVGWFWDDTFNPISGTATFSGLQIDTTVNQTGGANGITRGLYVNPTLTAAADFRGIEVSLGGFLADSNLAFGAGSGYRFGDGDMEIYESADDLLKFDPGVDSVTAFQFLDADGGVPILNIDTVNERVCVRCAAPIAELDILGVSIAPASDGSTGILAVRTSVSDDGLRMGVLDTSYVWIQSFNALPLRINQRGNEVIFNGVSSIGMGPGNIAPTGTLHIQDRTVTTGDTLVIFKEGAAVSNNLLEMQDSSGNLGWTFSSPLRLAAGRAVDHDILAWGGSTTGEEISFGAVNNYTQTSGLTRHIIFEATFAPTSGTAIFNSLNIESTINQTGGASGISRGIYINPSISAAADFRGIEIEDGGLYVVLGGIDVTFGTIKFGDVDPIASATTTALTVNNMFHITGTTTITALNTCDSENNGRPVTLIFDGILTFTDGNNLKLAGDFVTTADDTIDLICDGTNWYEISRSIN